MPRIAPPRRRRVFAALLLCGLAGCSNYPGRSGIEGLLPAQGPLVPDTTLNLGPGTMIALEKLVYFGAVAAAAYLVLDPRAPNWHIEEARFPGDHVHLSLAMKRYYAGGAGEARAVFGRRAQELARAGGFTGFEIVEYSEGMESSLLGAQRTATGVIRLTRG